MDVDVNNDKYALRIYTDKKMREQLQAEADRNGITSLSAMARLILFNYFKDNKKG